ncbi:MAG TPA: hypothetical protein DHW64_13625, partial [Chitinophagaceae bacterium]|nr:hypothetical protein [Chitinophagaceae bacterium]
MKNIAYIPKGLVILVLVLLSFVSNTSAQKFGDNLGNHIASDTLRMNGFRIVNAQGIAIGTARILNNNIALQIDGLDKALLLPRVTDTLAIPNANAVNGMLVYSLVDDKFYFRQNGVWVNFGTQNNIAGVVSFNGQVGAITMSGDESTGIKVTNVPGTNEWIVSAMNTTSLWSASRLMGRQISGTAPTNGQAYIWDTGLNAWVPKNVGNLAAPTVTGQKTDSIVTTINGTLRKIPSSHFLFVTDTAAMLSGYVREQRFLDSLAAIRASMAQLKVNIDTLPNLVVTGTITGGTYSGTLAPTAQASITNLANVNSITATNAKITNANITNLTGLANLSATGTIQAGTLSSTNATITNLSGLTNLSVSNTVQAGSVSATNITGSSGIFDNITVTGNIIGGTISATLNAGTQNTITNLANIQNITASGTISTNVISATTANISNLTGVNNFSVTNTIQAGTVSATNANITNLSGLSNLSVTGTAQIGTVSATSVNGGSGTFDNI